MLPVTSRQLIDFLEEVDKQLARKITLVAAGGTAMTLYGLKPSTIDVDFTGPMNHVELFKQAVGHVQPGFKVDAWPNGQVFSQFLPADYLKRSDRIKTHLDHIDLRALAPLDIVVTKLGRLDERDFEDIKACIKRYGIGRQRLIERAEETEYAGNRNVYNHNLNVVLVEFFGNAKRKPSHQL